MAYKCIERDERLLFCQVRKLSFIIDLDGSVITRWIIENSKPWQFLKIYRNFLLNITDISFGFVCACAQKTVAARIYG